MARKSAFLMLAVVLLTAIPCKSQTLVSGRLFSGRVTDEFGRPVVRARVEVGGRETVTGGDGSFKLEVVPEGSSFVLNISHPDFADFSHVTRRALENQTWPLVRAQISTVDPKAQITLTDKRPDLKIGGATFTLPANSLVDAGGAPPAGSVRAAIATLDVANGQGPGDWAVRSDDGRQEGFLVSYGAVFVQFTNATGSVKYQLRSGRSGQVTLPVIPNMARFAPNDPTARFWFYDTKDGYWKHNGNARFDPSTRSYRGSVNHLSTINTDIAKFNNAACLKITLHPSVPFGRKLRIRYHSGGTPFGQTPTFVMNDVDNAAYRLPANTNVLLELLDAVTNEVFGNLVVEDPPGTPLVNTVVNTGPPLPPGANLWPPPPYTPCKPILLKQQLPQVEIRINEVVADPATKDNPSDDYITWAPTFSRARLVTPGADTNIVLTNDPAGSIAGGGDVAFAANVTPWPVNTTATAATLSLTLPGSGAWVPFVVAGKFGTPSRNDKDTIIEAHLTNAAGPIIGTKALMVRVRKDGNILNSSERARFLFAWRTFRNQLGANFVRFQEMHRLASSISNDQGHMQPAFLPWHRVMLLDVERELQKIDPTVALHYWDWDAAAPNIFAQNFMGAADMSGGPFSIAEPIFAASNPLNGWNTDLPFASGELRRSGSNHTLAPAPGTFKPLDSMGNPSLVDRLNYGVRVVFAGTDFSDEVEELSHNIAHGWPCGGGHVTMPVRSAADPLFYMLHSNIDRQWAYWQQKRNRQGVAAGGLLTFPAPAHYSNAGVFDAPGVTLYFKGSYLEDGQWPWDGTTNGPAGRARRPVNQATAPGSNIPVSMPVIPMTPFPSSVTKNLWPAAASIPRPRHMIDYLGRFQPSDGLGFCYDDVPY